MIGAEMLSNPKYQKIGGQGLTVEIDESMFGKRKVILLTFLLNFKILSFSNIEGIF